MTGMHMGHCRIRKNSSVRGQDHFLESDITVAEMLKPAGYVSGMVGKWGNGLPGTQGTPDKQGFEYSFGFYDQSHFTRHFKRHTAMPPAAYAASHGRPLR